MNLKSFIIASLIIHVVGAIALYFYYNPITLDPEPVEQLEEENLMEEPEQEIKPKIKKSFFKRKKRKQIKDTLKEEPVPEPPKTLVIKKPSAPAEEPTIETEDSPVDLNLEEIKEEAVAPALPEEPAIAPTVPEEPVVAPVVPEPAIEEPATPENLEDFEEIEEEEEEKEPVVTPPAVPKETPTLPEETKTEPATPENLEDYEEIEEEEEEPTKTPQAPSETEDSPTSKRIKPDIQRPDSPAFRNFNSLKQKRGNPSLSYPDFARRKKMEGTVSVLFFVTPRGLVEKIQLESSSGHNELDNFVIRTLAFYEFFPGQEAWVRYKIPFILEGEEVETLRLRQNTEESEE